ncbi:hypothetical protein LX36DRAFT_657003 [Colletotrichum falcatum]|nr:hypothetical protein LX36DRAFT_657003 [Colletotrichum falcatum]
MCTSLRSLTFRRAYYKAPQLRPQSPRGRGPADPSYLGATCMKRVSNSAPSTRDSRGCLAEPCLSSFDPGGYGIRTLVRKFKERATWCVINAQRPPDRLPFDQATVRGAHSILKLQAPSFLLVILALVLSLPFGLHNFLVSDLARLFSSL